MIITSPGFDKKNIISVTYLLLKRYLSSTTDTSILTSNKVLTASKMLDFITYEVIILFFFSIFVFLYYMSKIKHKALERTGIKHLEPAIVFGNLFWTVTGREHLSSTIKKIYDSFPCEKYIIKLY